MSRLNKRLPGGRHNSAFSPYKIPQVAQDPGDVVPEDESEPANTLTRTSESTKFLATEHLTPDCNASATRFQCDLKCTLGWAERLYTAGMEQQAKFKEASKRKEELELKECTGRPKINARSRAMFGDLGKMASWQERQDRIREERLARIV